MDVHEGEKTMPQCVTCSRYFRPSKKASHSTIKPGWKGVGYVPPQDRVYACSNKCRDEADEFKDTFILDPALVYWATGDPEKAREIISERERAEIQFVYLFRAENGRHKIGASKDPER